jgi:hypothetical protein
MALQNINMNPLGGVAHGTGGVNNNVHGHHNTPHHQH